MTDKSQQFASDNYSGICPEAWAAMEQANHGHQRAYGDDEWTARAADHFRKLFETDCEVFFAFNGTAANSLALSSLCQSYHSVICSENRPRRNRRMRRAGILLQRLETADRRH
jgi:threonine aldolase